MKAFINAVLSDAGFPTINDVSVVNPFNAKTYIDEKVSIIDTRAKDRDGNMYNVEVQVRSQADFQERSLYYWAKAYAEQHTEGHEYRALHKVISISIVDFTLFPDHIPFHSCFMLRENGSPDYVLTFDCVLHYLETPKLKAKPATEAEEWLYLLLHAGKEDETMKILIDNNKYYKQAMKRYEYFAADEQARLAYEARQKFFARPGFLYHFLRLIVVNPANIESLLTPEWVLILSEPGITRDAVIHALCDVVTRRWPGVKTEDVREAVMKREEVLPTRLSPLLALPHAVLPSVTESRLAAAVVPGGVAWDSDAEHPVHLVLLLAGSREEHLPALSALAERLREGSLPARLAEARSPEEFVSLFTGGAEAAPRRYRGRYISALVLEEAFRLRETLPSARLVLHADALGEARYIESLVS